MSYTNQTNIESYLGRELTSAEVAFLPYILAGADRTITDRLGGSYGAVSATSRYYDSDCKRTIVFDPAYEIDSVERVDGDTGNTVLETYVIGEDLELYPLNETVKSYMTKRFGYFTGGLDKIKITGKFGLGETVPDEIVYIATYIASNMLTSSQLNGIKKEEIEGYMREYIIFDAETDAEINRILGSNKEILL